MKLADNLYAYLWPGVTLAEMQRYGNNCNSYLIANALFEGKHVVIDPGQIVNEVGQRCLDRLIVEMDKDGIRVDDIGLIIYTHAHPDHYEAGPAIKKVSSGLRWRSGTSFDFALTSRAPLTNPLGLVSGALLVRAKSNEVPERQRRPELLSQ